MECQLHRLRVSDSMSDVRRNVNALRYGLERTARFVNADIEISFNKGTPFGGGGSL